MFYYGIYFQKKIVFSKPNFSPGGSKNNVNPELQNNFLSKPKVSPAARNR